MFNMKNEEKVAVGCVAVIGNDSNEKKQKKCEKL
jgi:hypothetical protein